MTLKGYNHLIGLYTDSYTDAKLNSSNLYVRIGLYTDTYTGAKLNSPRSGVTYGMAHLTSLMHSLKYQNLRPFPGTGSLADPTIRTSGQE